MPGLGLVSDQGVWQEASWVLLSCRARADSASSSLIKLEFGAGERRCHWADWVEVGESRDARSAPSPASSPPQATPGLRAPSAQPWEVPIAGWPPSWSPQTISALHLTKMSQGLGTLARPSGVPQRCLSGVNATSSAFHALIPSPSSRPCVSLFLMLSPKPLHLASPVPFQLSCRAARVPLQLKALLWFLTACNIESTLLSLP